MNRWDEIKATALDCVGATGLVVGDRELVHELSCPDNPLHAARIVAAGQVKP